MPSTPQQIAPSSNAYLNAIQWSGWRWQDGPAAGTNITYFFGASGQNLDSAFGYSNTFKNSLTWTATEKSTYQAALQTWANVANITFTEVASYGSADLVEWMFSNAGTGILGIHESPEGAAAADGTAWGAYNRSSTSWNTGGLAAGGYDFTIFVHELGHALGLKHPHDNFGGSSVFPGVTVEDWSDLGDNNLNQGIFTVMSYNDGWQTGPSGNSTSANFGWQSGPMAFDIAAIQYLYGANTSYHAGNDTYTLPDAEAAGTFWSSIWDAGGTDQIVYNGTRNVTINLTAATLDNSPTGGGVPSFANGIHGGYTIANGVVIENASAGSGNDLLTGNGAANLLDGGSGADAMSGGAGNDVYVVDSAGDQVIENVGQGFDTVRSAVSFALQSNLEALELQGSANLIGWGNGSNDALYGNSGSNKLYGDAGHDTLVGFDGNDYLDGATGGDALYGGNGNDTLHSGDGNDLLNGGAGDDWLIGAAGDDIYVVDSAGDQTTEIANEGFDTVRSAISLALQSNLEALELQGSANLIGWGNGNGNALYGNSGNNNIYGDAGHDTLVGFDGNDYLDGATGGDALYGGNGNDTLHAGDGDDLLNGGAGDDRLFGATGNDLFVFNGLAGADIVGDFTAGAGIGDVIQLDDAQFANFAAVLAATNDDGLGNTVIAGAGGSITLTGVLKAQLNSNDFQFV